MKQEKMITAKEVAGLMGWSTDYVRKLARAPECEDFRIPHYKIGGSYWFKLSEVETWLNMKADTADADSRSIS